MAGDVLNFDTLHGEPITITKTPPGEQESRVFRLYDDIPAELMLGVFGMQEVVRRMQEAVKAQDTERFDAAWTTYQEEIAVLCGEIFRHTYPAIEDDEICAIFTHAERDRIVQLFFGRRSDQLKGQLPATTPDTASNEAAGSEPLAKPSESTVARSPVPLKPATPRHHAKTRAERRARARMRAAATPALVS